MYSGPHIKRDGLVFGYDTGYGISDKDTSTRFYPGAPTTNTASTDNSRTMFKHYSGHVMSFSEAPEKGEGWRKINISTISAGNFRLAQFPYITNPGGTQRTYSVEYDVTGLTGYKFRVDGSGGYSTISITGKGRHQFTITPSTAGSYALFLTNSNSATGLNHTIYYRFYQVEDKSTTTPFTTGTRSSTESLIDLTKTTDIDVSNVSFNSTGQPTFDGTDDYINTNQTPTVLGIHSSSYTMEAVFKLNSTSGDNMVFGTNQTSQFNGLHNGVRNGVFYHAHYSADRNAGSASANTWYHVIWIHTGSLSIMYVNGSPINSLASHGAFTSTYNVWIGRHWGHFNGQIPVAKIYNRALSATEVKQNYRAYKNRFDI